MTTVRGWLWTDRAPAPSTTETAAAPDGAAAAAAGKPSRPVLTAAALEHARWAFHGADRCRLERFDAQAARHWATTARSLLAAAALTASGTAVDRRRRREIAGAVAVELLREAYLRVAGSSDLFPANLTGETLPAEIVRAWRRALKRELRQPLEHFLRESTVADLMARGLPLPDAVVLDARIVLNALRALAGADDVLATLWRATRAERTGAPTPGRSLESLLSADHAGRVVISLAGYAADHLEQDVVRAAGRGGELTGRRRWVSDPEGRHGTLNGVVVAPGENWRLPKRALSNGRALPAVDDVPFPRFDPQDTAEWSGSTAMVGYETEAGQFI